MRLPVCSRFVAEAGRLMIRVSVVIATFNRRHLLQRTLPLLLQQDFPAEEYEVLVVVDGSTDGTIEYLRTLNGRGNLHFIEQSNQGQAAAINRGLKTARGEIILFLDDDILCEATVIAEHANVVRTEKNCLAFGPVLVSPEGNDPIAVDWARTFCDDFFAVRANLSPELGWYGCMASANASMPRRTALAAGGLDASFSRGNDVEFGFRLVEAGYRFVYIPGAVTKQIFAKTRREVIEDARGEGSAEIRLCRKFPPLRLSARFSSLAKRPWWKRQIVRALSTLPFPVGATLAPVVWIFDKLRSVPTLRRAALWLFQVQQNIAAYRSAAREAGSWKQLESMFAARLPVLMYHSVGPLRPGFDPFLTISPEMLEGDLRWIKEHGYTPIRCTDWIGYLRDGVDLPDKPVLLTFDDAYRDTAQFGLPILRKYGYTGTVFVVTNQIGGTNQWDLPLGLSQQPLMSADEIREWAAQGIEFGAHSCSHADLRRISKEELHQELKGSREALEQLLGVPVPAFAYPYGYINDKVIEAARAHFDLALTCDIGINSPSVDALRMRRATIVPGFRFGARTGAMRLGFNVLLVAKIQASLRMKRLVRRDRSKYE